MSYTFAQLKTAIQDFTENTESSFVTNLPTFIKNTENRIFKLVDLEVFRKNATSSLTSSDAGDPFLSVPTDYLSSFSLSVTVNSENSYFKKMLTSYKSTIQILPRRVCQSIMLFLT